MPSHSPSAACSRTTTPANGARIVVRRRSSSSRATSERSWLTRPVHAASSEVASSNCPWLMIFSSNRPVALSSWIEASR
jgi:hypothetical protein